MQRVVCSNGGAQTPANTPQLKASSPVQHIGNSISNNILCLPPIVEENYGVLRRSLLVVKPPKLTRQHNTLVDVALNLEAQGYNIYGSSWCRKASMRIPSDSTIVDAGRSQPKCSAAYSAMYSDAYSDALRLAPISK